MVGRSWAGAGEGKVAVANAVAAGMVQVRRGVGRVSRINMVVPRVSGRARFLRVGERARDEEEPAPAPRPAAITRPGTERLEEGREGRKRTGDNAGLHLRLG